MPSDNRSRQSGNDSLNVGEGNFREAYIHIGDNVDSNRHFTTDELGIERRIIGGRRIMDGKFGRTVSGVFAIVTGFAGLASLYFSMFPPFASPTRASWSTLGVFLSILMALSCGIYGCLRRKIHFNSLGGQVYLEIGNREGVYLTKLSAKCPWCGSLMKLEHVSPVKELRSDIFVCERNYRQHRIVLDPTVLDEIVES